MGRKAKRGERGVAAQHLTRAAALKKLQLSLADFRRLCIFKGVYPRDPKKKLKGRDKTYYHAKDILYLWHEPLLNRFRELKVHDKKVKRALGRKEKSIARGLVSRKPAYTLYHVVKERYPSLLDCIRDLDDALCCLALFASLPTDSEKDVTADVVAESTRLFDEFLLFAVQQRLVRNAFCSIKGFYIQLKYLGQFITFLIPHQFPQDLPADVDFKVLLTFLELYRCVLKSVNFKVYQIAGLQYPPVANYQMLKAGCRYLSLTAQPLLSSRGPETTNLGLPNVTDTDAQKDSILPGDGKAAERLATKLQTVTSRLMMAAAEDNQEEAEREQKEGQEGDDGNEDEDGGNADPAFAEDDMTKAMHQLTEEEQKVRSLFSGKIFFISREVPRLPVAFLLQACGASSVGWHSDLSPIGEDDESITHHILDRPIVGPLLMYQSTREMVQPQWVFDSINSGVCLPCSPYRSGIPPPPHLSPFVDDAKEGYIPQQRVVLEQLAKDLSRKGDGGAMEEEEDLEGEDGESQDTDEVDDEDRDLDCVEAEEAVHQQHIQEEIGVFIERASEENRNKEPKVVAKKFESVGTKQQAASHALSKKILSKKREQKEAEERERRKALLSKKHKRLLHRIEFTKQKTSEKVSNLNAKKI